MDAYASRKSASLAAADPEHRFDPAHLRKTASSAKLAYYTVVGLFSLLVLPPVAFCLLTRGRMRRKGSTSA